jgi:hypothetical protein
MPLTEELRDTFNDNVVDTTKWPSNYNTGAGGLPTETGGRARVVCSTGFSAYTSDNTYTLADSHIWAEVFPPAAGGAATEAWAQLLITSSTSGTDAIFEVNAVTGLLTMAVRVGFFDAGATTLAYSSVTHRWLRIREDSGTLFWDTSADGLTWTNRRSTASPGWESDLDLEIQLITHRDSGVDDVAEFDQFNVIPSSAVFADLTDNFDDNVVDTTKWPDNYGTPAPSETGGRARVPCTDDFAAYASSPIYRLEGSHVGAQVFPPDGADDNEAYAQILVLSDVAGTQIVFEVDAVTSLLLMTVYVDFVDEGGASVPYDPVEHAWLRVREDAGTLYWDTSPDGREWTTRHTDTAPSWTAENDLQVQLLAHCSPLVTGGPASTDYAEFDDFNITPLLAEGYTVAVDWAGDGDFDGPFDNVTADVLERGPAVFQYGRDQARALSPPGVGSIAFTVCNADRIYSPENPDSPIADDLTPAAPITVETVVDNVLYPLFRGRVDDLTVHPDRSNRSMDITGLDELSLLRGTNISTELYAAQRTGTLIGVILDAIGWTGPRDLDLGATHVPWWWLEETDAFTAVADLLASEGPPSIAYVGPDGTFIFRDRHHRLLRDASLTSQATFASRLVDCETPAVTGFSFIEPFEYSHGWRDIINQAAFDVDERRPASTFSVVWESDDTISLSLGQSVTVEARASDPFRDAQDLIAGTDIITVGAGTALTTISRRSGQSTVISILAVGAGLTVTHLQVRARSVPTARTVKVAADDSVSIARYGQRSNQSPAPWVNAHDAAAITQLLLVHYAQRRPTVGLRLVSSDAAHLMQILTRTISDLITIRHGELGLDASFHIENLAHTLTRIPSEVESATDCPPRVHYAVLGCERSGLVVPVNPFTFDKTGAGFDDGVFDPTAADNPDTVFVFDDPVQGQFDTGQFGT